MGSFLSKYQLGFRKSYNTQICLLSMLENSKLTIDNGKVFGLLTTGLSELLDCLW